MRVSRLAAALVADALLAAALAPGIALAQGGTGNALTPGLPQPQATIPTTTTPPTTSPVVPQTSTTSPGSASGLTGTDAIAIAAGAVIVLGGIAYFIWYDARRRAPRRGRLATAGAPGRRAGSKTPPKPRKLSPAERRRRKRGRAR